MRQERVPRARASPQEVKQTSALLQAGIGRRGSKTSTIHARLLVAFVVMVTLPVVVTSAVSNRLGANNLEQRTIAQLESVVTLKEAELNTWVDDLRTSLDLILTGDELTRYTALLLQEPDSPEYSRAYSLAQSRLRYALERTKRFQELYIMDRQGRVVVSTDPMQESKIFRTEPYFLQGLKGPYVQPPSYSPSLGAMLVIAARPFLDSQGQAAGVLAGRANMETLYAIMLERAGLGATGETYLVGANYALVTRLRLEEHAPGET